MRRITHLAFNSQGQHVAARLAALCNKPGHNQHHNLTIYKKSLICNLRPFMLVAGVEVSLSLLSTSKRGTSDAASPSFTERDAALFMQGGYFQEFRTSTHYGFTH